MKLFDGGKAPNPRRVRVFLAEKGIEVPLVPVDMGAMEHKKEAVTARNPLQRLPILELDDGTILTESVAICRYFEELHPEPALFGRGALGKALVEMWQRRLELGLFIQAAMTFRHTSPLMEKFENQVKAWGEENRTRIEKTYHWLNKELEGKTFIAGPRFSIADITGLVAMDFAGFAGVEIPAACANVKRWHDTLAARPSAKA